jgi:hypothetical protein
LVAEALVGIIGITEVVAVLVVSAMQQVKQFFLDRCIRLLLVLVELFPVPVEIVQIIRETIASFQEQVLQPILRLGEVVAETPQTLRAAEFMVLPGVLEAVLLRQPAVLAIPHQQALYRDMMVGIESMPTHRYLAVAVVLERQEILTELVEAEMVRLTQ